MTQEDKQLLLKDLCARLPYGTECCYMDDEEDRFTLSILDNCGYVNESYPIKDVKPFLRPMSNMTKEERKEYEQWLPDEYCIDTFDWLNAHHFDYRGLIEKGLALPAPEGMYNNKTE